MIVFIIFAYFFKAFPTSSKSQSKPGPAKQPKAPVSLFDDEEEEVIICHKHIFYRPSPVHYVLFLHFCLST